jgi:hypothetical protein
MRCGDFVGSSIHSTLIYFVHSSKESKESFLDLVYQVEKVMYLDSMESFSFPFGVS